MALAPNAHVIFVSAYTQYALLCYQSHAFDFLVKPFTPAQLSSCVDAVLVDIAKRSTGIPLVVTVDSRIRRLDQCRILYFGRQRGYVLCHMLNGDFHWRESFSALYERLAPDLILRAQQLLSKQAGAYLNYSVAGRYVEAQVLVGR